MFEYFIEIKQEYELTALGEAFGKKIPKNIYDEFELICPKSLSLIFEVDKKDISFGYSDELGWARIRFRNKEEFLAVLMELG